MNIEELEDDERLCYICGGKGCMFELQLWNYIDEGESVTDESWWLCDAHQAPVIHMLASYLEGYRKHIIEYDINAIESGMNLRKIELEKKKERKEMRDESKRRRISIGLDDE